MVSLVPPRSRLHPEFSVGRVLVVRNPSKASSLVEVLNKNLRAVSLVPGVPLLPHLSQLARRAPAFSVPGQRLLQQASLELLLRLRRVLVLAALSIARPLLSTYNLSSLFQNQLVAVFHQS